MAIVLEATKSAERDVPDYLQVDHDQMKGTFVRAPKLADVPYPVRWNRTSSSSSIRADGAAPAGDGGAGARGEEPMPWLKIVIVLLLILLNGFFAMAEMAVISARKARLQHAADRGRERRARRARAEARCRRFLSTVQIGITAISVLASVLGGADAGRHDGALACRRRRLGGAPTPRAISFAAVVIAISYLTLIFGELVPEAHRAEPARGDRQRLVGHAARSPRAPRGRSEWFLEQVEQRWCCVWCRCTPPSRRPSRTRKSPSCCARATAPGHFERGRDRDRADGAASRRPPGQRA